MISFLKIFFTVLPIVVMYLSCNYSSEQVHKKEFEYCMKKFNIDKMVMDLPGVVENGTVDEKLYNIYYEHIHEHASSHCRDLSR